MIFAFRFLTFLSFTFTLSSFEASASSRRTTKRTPTITQAFKTDMLGQHTKLLRVHPFFVKIRAKELTPREFVQSIVNDLELYRALEANLRENSWPIYSEIEGLARQATLESDLKNALSLFQMKEPKPTLQAKLLAKELSEARGDKLQAAFFILYYGLTLGNSIKTKLAEWLQERHSVSETDTDHYLAFHTFTRARKELSTEILNLFPKDEVATDSPKFLAARENASYFFLMTLASYKSLFPILGCLPYVHPKTLYRGGIRALPRKKAPYAALVAIGALVLATTQSSCPF